MATQISNVLQGKYKPIFHRQSDCGDHVVVINTQAAEFSGQKWEQKLYRRHTGFPGGFREERVRLLCFPWMRHLV